MRSVVPAILASTLALSACGGSSSSSSNPPATTDSGTTATDASTSTVTDASTVNYPTGPYGARVGAYFRPFSLQSCNNNDMWDFTGTDFSTSSMTVISIAAGWCVPCQMESGQIQATIASAFASQHVRVVQVLVQNPDHTAITSDFCNTWVARYGIMFPELMDPLMTTSAYTPNQAFPSNIIVDSHGIVRYLSYGESTGLTDLVSAINDVLSNPDNPGQ